MKCYTVMEIPVCKGLDRQYPVPQGKSVWTLLEALKDDNDCAFDATELSEIHSYGVWVKSPFLVQVPGLKTVQGTHFLLQLGGFWYHKHLCGPRAMLTILCRIKVFMSVGRLDIKYLLLWPWIAIDQCALPWELCSQVQAPLSKLFRRCSVLS